MAVADQALAVGEGLDRLELPVAHTGSRSRRIASVVLPKVAAVVFLLAVWQLIVSLRLRPDYVIPGPFQVWSTLVEQWKLGNVTQAVWTSVSRGAIGFGLSVLVGTPFGLLVARVRLVRLALGSLISALQSLPSVTWVPLGLVAFGPNETTIYFVVIMGAFPSIVNGMVHAVDQIPPLLLSSARSMGARGWRLWWLVLLPAARPGYIAGLRQGWSFSWRSLMAAELITRSSDLGLGLGQLLDSGRELLDMSLVIASIALILVVGIAVDALVFNPLDRAVRERRGLLPDATGPTSLQRAIRMITIMRLPGRRH
jgi:NitT/TauT family transport system permease protein